MTEIRFYHLQKQSLDQALPQILGKALSVGHKILVKLPDSETVERINQHLWVYRPDSFLPHGSKKDGNPENQPIWLTESDENANNADVLITGNGSIPNEPENYSLCCEMLDGHNDEHVQAARDRWKTYKEKGFEVTYWKQSETGAWEKKS